MTETYPRNRAWDRNGCRTQNPKWDRWNRWLIQRYIPRSFGYKKQWKVTPPIDPTSDYMDVKYFETHDEALEFCNREWCKRKLLSDFEEYLETVQNPWVSKDSHHTGLDTILRLLDHMNTPDLAYVLENV